MGDNTLRDLVSLSVLYPLGTSDLSKHKYFVAINSLSKEVVSWDYAWLKSNYPSVTNLTIKLQVALQ